MNEDLKLAVKQGAYFLDSYLPSWASAIRLDDLEMDDCASCIVGQAMGNYSTTLSEASGCEMYSQAAYDWAVEKGFDIPQEFFEISVSYANQCYRELEELWTEQVRERLAD